MAGDLTFPYLPVSKREPHWILFPTFLVAENSSMNCFKWGNTLDKHIWVFFYGFFSSIGQIGTGNSTMNQISCSLLVINVNNSIFILTCENYIHYISLFQLLLGSLYQFSHRLYPLLGFIEVIVNWCIAFLSHCCRFSCFELLGKTWCFVTVSVLRICWLLNRYFNVAHSKKKKYHRVIMVNIINFMTKSIQSH